MHETTEEGESLLSLACSAGYYELAQVLLAMHASVEDRGIKVRCLISLMLILVFLKHFHHIIFLLYSSVKMFSTYKLCFLKVLPSKQYRLKVP